MLVGLVLAALSWSLSPQLSPALCRSCRRGTAIVAALDYKHPDVAAEFAKVQPIDLEDVEEELAMKGVPPPPGMSDMDVRLMLVEMRMRMAGTLPDQGNKPKAAAPTSFGSKFEEALYERPAFKKLYDGWRDGRDTNSVNLAIEYLNNPEKALELYGGNERYDIVVGEIEKSMAAVVSSRLSFSGFPAAMGEPAVKMTLEAFGALKSLSCEASDDGQTCEGEAEFEEMDAAKAAIEKWNGVDMGLGTKLSLKSLA